MKAARAIGAAIAISLVMAPVTALAASASRPAPGPARGCDYTKWTVKPWIHNGTDVEYTPDAKHVVYSRIDTGSGGGNNSQTSIMMADLNAAGMPVNERNLTAGLAGENDTAVVSPDGKKIAFASSNGSLVNFAGGAGGPGANVWVMNIDGTHRRNLTPSLSGTSFRPRWAHGGSRLFYTHGPSAFDSYRWEMFVADFVDDASGGSLKNARMLNTDITDTAFYEDADFDHNNTGVYYTASTANSENYDIYHLDLKSGKIHRLTTSPELDESSHISPNGQHLAFISSRDHRSTWSVYATASAASGLPPVGDSFAVLAMAVVAWNQPVMAMGTDIYMMNADGRHVQRLTKFPDTVGGGVPTWSPDGCTVLTTAFQYPAYSENPYIAGTPYPGGQNTTYKIEFQRRR